MNQFLMLAIFSGIFVSSAHAISLSDCLSLSSNLNESTPQRVDKLTTMTGTTCFPGSKRPILIYRMQINIEDPKVPQSAINTMSAMQLQTWCSDPVALKLFRLVDIQYSYVDRSGKFMRNIGHTIESCPR